MTRREVFAKTFGALAALCLPAVATAAPKPTNDATNPDDYWIRLGDTHYLDVKVERRGSRRIFYIDLSRLPKVDADRFMERLKEQFPKKVRT